MSEMHRLLVRSQPGARVTVAAHIARAERIAEAINERWDFSTARQWRAKHVRWFLAERCTSVTMQVSTRYDYWRTVRVIAAALGQLGNWEPHLRGDWCRSGIGGRTPKLAHHRDQGK
jgi:hypothetical protein